MPSIPSQLKQRNRKMLLRKRRNKKSNQRSKRVIRKAKVVDRELLQQQLPVVMVI